MEPVKYNNKQEWIKLLLAVIIALAGIALLVVGMVTPPRGEIDSSVIVAAGEVFVFSSAILGIKLTFDYKLAKTITALQQENSKKSDGGK